jgi:hypothetical protein
MSCKTASAIFMASIAGQCFLASPLAANTDADASNASWLQLEYSQSTLQDDGTQTASSNGRQAVIETVIEETDEGVILKYDWPRDEDGQAQSNFWYLPIRVLEKPDGSQQLLDIETVEARVDAWLERYDISREACGKWWLGGGFPFRVDCDPQVALAQIEPFDLRAPQLREGGEFSYPLAKAPAKFTPLAKPRSGLTVTLEADAEKSRAAEVKWLLQMGQMLGSGLTREQAERDAAAMEFTGSITIEFDIDALGIVTKRTDRSELTVVRPGKGTETSRAVFTVERRDVSEEDGRITSLRAKD